MQSSLPEVPPITVGEVLLYFKVRRRLPPFVLLPPVLSPHGCVPLQVCFSEVNTLWGEQSQKRMESKMQEFRKRMTKAVKDVLKEEDTAGRTPEELSFCIDPVRVFVSQ